MDDNTQHLIKGLEFFKDWSNYLLVTTVAALGWVSTKDRIRLPACWLRVIVVLLALSVVFAIFTLALVPLVAEQITKSTKSIYDVGGSFRAFWMWGPEVSLTLKWVCWPQHVTFVTAILAYAFVTPTDSKSD